MGRGRSSPGHLALEYTPIVGQRDCALDKAHAVYTKIRVVGIVPNGMLTLGTAPTKILLSHLYLWFGR